MTRMLFCASKIDFAQPQQSPEAGSNLLGALKVLATFEDKSEELSIEVSLIKGGYIRMDRLEFELPKTVCGRRLDQTRLRASCGSAFKELYFRVYSRDGITVRRLKSKALGNPIYFSHCALSPVDPEV